MRWPNRVGPIYDFRTAAVIRLYYRLSLGVGALPAWVLVGHLYQIAAVPHRIAPDRHPGPAAMATKISLAPISIPAAFASSMGRDS